MHKHTTWVIHCCNSVITLLVFLLMVLTKYRTFWCIEITRMFRDGSKTLIIGDHTIITSLFFKFFFSHDSCALYLHILWVLNETAHWRRSRWVWHHYTLITFGLCILLAASWSSHLHVILYTTYTVINPGENWV